MMLFYENRYSNFTDYGTDTRLLTLDYLIRFKMNPSQYLLVKGKRRWGKGTRKNLVEALQ